MRARRLGIPARWFWAATPTEFAWEVEARLEQHRESRARIWMLAALMRQKKLPDFKRFTGIADQPQTWQQMRARVRAAAIDGVHGPDHRPQGSQPSTQTAARSRKR